jgi:hypothetical protein
MRVNRGFLDAFVNRFKVDVDEDWLRSSMECTTVSMLDESEDPAMLLRALQINFEKIYVPSAESFRIGRWIYSLARGFVAFRYQSAEEYVRVCMSPCSATGLVQPAGTNVIAPDSVPIYAVDGIPGMGKSALFRTLQRVFPPPMELSAEGDPPQRVGTLSALWVSVNSNFSLKTWMINTLTELGLDLSQHKGLKSIESLSPLLFKRLYRIGVSLIIIDELQFASGRTSAHRVLGLLLAMREFGIPIVFFANTDLLKNISLSPAQVTQRIPREKKTFSPMLRNDKTFARLIQSQLALVPFGHDIDVEKEAINIYDMVAGSHRGSARLIELGCSISIPEKRKLTIRDLIDAKESPSFDAMREHISILTATAPVDVKRYPELASNNDQFDVTGEYKRQLQQHQIEDAAAVALYASRSEGEREAARAAETMILRDAGKISPKVTALGESKRSRDPKPSSEEILKNSYAAKQLAKFSTKNPTNRDTDNSPKR